MKTLLVLSPQPGFAAAVRAALDPDRYRVVHQTDIGAAEALLHHGMVDACVLDDELTNIQPIRTIEKLRRRLPHCPLVVYSSQKQWEWEEEVYLMGAAQVLTKPVRGRLLDALLERLWMPTGSGGERPPVARAVRPAELRSADLFRGTVQALQVLRNFSGILSHSLCAEALLKQFLLLLREIVGVNRAAIFLRLPSGDCRESQDQPGSRALRSVCAIGLQPGLLEHLELSLMAGIGGFLYRQGRILRRDSEESLADLEIQKEFELLGAQVAVPVLDRESFMGVAVFDGRVTGEPLNNEELALIFHLLEQVGMAIRNIWLHDQLADSHAMMEDILRHLSSGCVVIGADLTLLHANDQARLYFVPPERARTMEFSDLPQPLGSRIFEVLKSNRAIPPFKYRPPNAPDRIYQVSIAPFRKEHTTGPSAALLVVEDVTQAEQLQELGVEAANLRLVKTIAERLAHEINNALVPLSTHQQLLAEKYDDPDFRRSLHTALNEGVKRVSRLVNQMTFLSRDTIEFRATFPLKNLIEEAFHEARKYQPQNASLVQYENGGLPLNVAGDRAALKHALAEIMLNALQANPADAQIQVRTRTETTMDGERWVHIEVQDSGTGFTPEAAKKVPEPFFTTRNVGLGLGLTVSRKIIETHSGKLEIAQSLPGLAGVVRVSLPLTPGRTETSARVEPSRRVESSPEGEPANGEGYETGS